MGVVQGDLRLLGVVMAVAFAGALAFGFGPSFRARRALTGAVRSSRHLGRGVEACWKSVLLVLVLGLLAAALAPDLLALGPLSLLGAWDVRLSAAGAAVFVVGATLAGVSARHLGAQLTVEIEVREGGGLVTSGPYAYIRHPIYTGILLMEAGLAVALASPLMGVAGLLAVVCARTRALAEEQMLESDPVIGPGYPVYLARTGRFLPPAGRRN